MVLAIEYSSLVPPGDGAKAMSDSTQKSANLRPPCSRCGKPLILTHVEPKQPGFELRVYYCASCGAGDRVIDRI